MKSPQKLSGERQAQRMREMARQQRLLNLKKNREALIPDRVLKALAEMRLPKNKRVYNARLRELLGA